ncbi:toxin-antitoxin system, antitoxin component [Candidatus Parcubacteria bacterium]|nr:MAG: toxin-antitoxin system, antitoxin component [Candidatus Parcubacteria bacterium]
MATTKKRINISVSDDVNDALERLAKRDQEPVATKAADLLEMALEIEEDHYFAQVANDRLKGKVRWIPDSDTVWE